MIIKNDINNQAFQVLILLILTGIVILIFLVFFLNIQYRSMKSWNINSGYIIKVACRRKPITNISEFVAKESLLNLGFILKYESYLSKV